jgi:hypothetical protein
MSVKFAVIPPDGEVITGFDKPLARVPEFPLADKPVIVRLLLIKICSG